MLWCLCSDASWIISNNELRGNGRDFLARNMKMPIITTPIDLVLQSTITTNTKNSFGNQTLYDMCKNGSMLNPDELAD